MKFRYTIIYVDSVPETVAFYQQAFGLELGMLHESNDYGELKTGNTKLAFSSRRLMTELKKHPGRIDPQAPICEIAFETAEVEQALENAVKAGAELVQEATEMPWGQTIGYVRDCNGFLVEICTAVSPPQ